MEHHSFINFQVLKGTFILETSAKHKTSRFVISETFALIVDTKVINGPTHW